MVIVLIASKLSDRVGEYLATEKRVNKKVARRQRTSSRELQRKYTNNIYKSKKKVKILQLYPSMNFARTRESTRTHVTYRKRSVSWVIKILHYKEVN